MPETAPQKVTAFELPDLQLNLKSMNRHVAPMRDEEYFDQSSDTEDKEGGTVTEDQGKQSSKQSDCCNRSPVRFD